MNNDCYVSFVGRQGRIIADNLTEAQMRAMASEILSNYTVHGKVGRCFKAIADGVLADERALYSFIWITKSGHFVALEQTAGDRRVVIGNDRSHKFYTEIEKLARIAKWH